jgi:hypothetical protein
VDRGAVALLSYRDLAYFGLREWTALLSQNLGHTDYTWRTAEQSLQYGRYLDRKKFVYGARAVYTGTGARLLGRSWCLRVSSSSVNKEGKCPRGNVFGSARQASAYEY